MSAVRFVVMFAAIAFLGFAGGFIADDAMTEAEKPLPVLASAELRPEPMPYTLPLQYAAWTIYWCDKADVPVWLISRLYDVESWWNPHAVSHAGARGIAQIIESNFADFSKRYNSGRPIDPHDPETAIRVGILYLADLYATFKDWPRAVGAYNAGPYVAPGKWKNETVRYVRAILG